MRFVTAALLSAAVTACSGPREPAVTLFFAVDPGQIVDFKEDMESVSERLSLEFTDSSRATAEGRKDLPIEALDYQTNSLSYDEDRTVSLFAESKEDGFIALVVNGGQPCGVVALGLVFDPSDPKSRATANDFVAAIPGKWEIAHVGNRHETRGSKVSPECQEDRAAS